MGDYTNDNEQYASLINNAAEFSEKYQLTAQLLTSFAAGVVSGEVGHAIATSMNATKNSVENNLLHVPVLATAGNGLEFCFKTPACRMVISEIVAKLALPVNKNDKYAVV